MGKVRARDINLCAVGFQLADGTGRSCLAKSTLACIIPASVPRRPPVA